MIFALDVASVRVAVAAGDLAELTWFAPEVDLAGTHALGERAFVTGMVGYAVPDNHTYLSDGQDIRFVATGGTRIGDKLRASAGLGLELIAFHADPDVLTQHPGVDQLVHRRGTLPSVNVELAYPLGATTAIGVYALVALRDLQLFDTPTGDHQEARLVLAGAFLELQLR